MLQALRSLDPANAFIIDIVDIDTHGDPALLAQYNEWVPVLIGAKPSAQPVRLCHYHLDYARVREFLAG